MNFIYKNVFIGKDEKFNYSFNILYWFFKIFKEIFKWIYSVSLFSENKTLFALCFIAPIFKFIFISIQNIIAFKTNFRGNTPFIIISVFILIIESFFELPIHLMCPVNKIYLHTNYYRIYDKKISSTINNNLEGIECLVLLGFLLWYFCFGKFHYSAVVLIILVIPLVGFYIGAKVFFCCYEAIPEDDNDKNKDNKYSDGNKNQMKESKGLNVNIEEYQNVTQISDKSRAYPYY